MKKYSLFYNLFLLAIVIAVVIVIGTSRRLVVNAEVTLPSQCLPYSSAPVACAASTQGRCYTNTGDTFTYFCNGTSWLTSSNGAITTNLNFNSTTPYWTEFSNGNSGTAKTIDWTVNGAIQSITINGNVTFTFTAPPGPSRLQLRMKHDGSATTFTPVWPTCVLGTSGVCWPGGVAGANTNTANAEDLLVCTYNGANYDCTLTVNFS